MLEFSPLMLFHVIFGCVALLSGFLALLSQKGKQVHRAAGKIFVVSMILMALAGSFIAYQKPEMITFLAGVFTSYLVISAFVTVRHETLLATWKSTLLTFPALCIGVAGIYYGNQAVQNADKLYDGFPAAPYFFFGALALLAAAMDFKIYVQKSISKVHKVARHAWRMSFALLMAAASFFDGPGANTFPAALHGSFLLLLPQCVVAVLLVWWLIRILYYKKVS